MLSHLWLKNRTIVSRWKIDYAKLNKHRFLAWVQMSLHHCAKAAARGDEARLLGRGKGRVCSPPQPLSAVVPPQQHEGFAIRVAGEISVGEARRELTQRPASSRGTWIWRCGLIWGPEQSSQKGMSARSGAITSESRTLPLQAQGGRRWGFPALPLVGIFSFSTL